MTMNEGAKRTLLAVGSADPSRAGQPAACLTGAVCYRTKHRIGRSLCCGLDESDICGRGARGDVGGIGNPNALRERKGKVGRGFWLRKQPGMG